MLDFFTYIIHSRNIELSKNELKLIEFIFHTDTIDEFLLNYLISFVENKLIQNNDTDQLDIVN